MAPLINASRLGKEKRLNSILTFAAELETCLSAFQTSRFTTAVIDKLEHYTQNFPDNLGSAAIAHYEELDKSGTTLWNLSTRLKRNINLETQQTSVVFAMTRLFSFMMLDAAQRNRKSSFSNSVRVMQVALKTAKTCLELKHLDYALKALERAAELEEGLKNPTAQMTAEDSETHMRLRAKYFVLRTMLEWRLGRLEVAEHLFTKASLPECLLDPNTTESLADLLFEMGKELLVKRQFDLAVKWLDRAFNVLSSEELDKLSIDASELRTSIIQCSIKALLRIQKHDAAQKAHDLVELLESEVGDKLVVLLLRLELLSASSETFDSVAYSTVVQRIIRSVVLTDSSFKLILHHIRKLNDKSPGLACNALDELLQTRLFEAEKEEWIEMVLINRIWMATSQRDGNDVFSSIHEILASVASNLTKPISSSATFAAQMLLWKRIESNNALAQHDAAEAWCRAALHPIFANAGDLNKAKISRKLLLCCLARQDISGAQEIYGTLSQTAKNDPKTQFLMYKIAIRAGEAELASKCLEVVHSASLEDSNLLYACVLDAQQVGDKDLAIAALQLVLEKYQYNAPSTVHLPALLRCMIRLIISQLESKNVSTPEFDLDAIIDSLCKLFEVAALQAQKSVALVSSEMRLFNIDELDWFSKNAYNFSLKHAADCEPRKVLRIIHSCVLFISFYPEDVDQQVTEDLLLRQVFCDFLATVLLISIARAEDSIEAQLQDYLTIRKHVDSFDTNLQKQLGKLEEGPAEDLVKKLSILLAYDFEAAVRLKNWNDLGGIIIKADTCKNMKVYELMADCLLCCEAPAHVVVATLKRIVNAAWEVENFDIVKLSRYMRCVFQYALPEGGQIAEGLLDQAYELAQEASQTEISYPAEELEWISTTAFNRAVDYYCAGEDEVCRAWAAKAINIASFCPDQGGLQVLLEKKLLGLNWNADT